MARAADLHSAGRRFDPGIAYQKVLDFGEAVAIQGCTGTSDGIDGEEGGFESLRVQPDLLEHDDGLVKSPSHLV